MTTRLLLTVILALAAASAAAMAARPVEPRPGCDAHVAAAPVRMVTEIASAEPMTPTLRARVCRGAVP